MRALPVACALVAICVLAGLVLLRAPYAFELEWMEGGMLAHVERVRDGLPIYAEPSLEFGAFPYTPVFAWASAGASFITGETFLALRVVSICATIASSVLLFDIGRRRQSPLAGLLSAGLFAAGYRWAGAWFDVGRVDSLSFAFALAALHVALFKTSARAAFFAAVLAAGACFTKQSALLFSLALTPAFAPFGVRRAAVYLATFVAVSGTAIAALQRASEGWFKFWTWDMLRNAPTHEPAVLGYWTECGAAVGAAAALVVAALLTRSWAGPGVPLAMPCIALVLTGWIGRAHEGGAANNLIAPLVAVALVFGPAAAAWMEPRRSALAASCAALAFVPLAYDPRPLLPSDSDREAGERMANVLAELEPPVFLPAHSYLLDRARPGKGNDVVHSMVINDLLKSGLDEAAGHWAARLVDALDGKVYGAVVLDEPWPELLALSVNYGPPERLFDEDDETFYPVTGAPRRPTFLYERK